MTMTKPPLLITFVGLIAGSFAIGYFTHWSIGLVAIGFGLSKLPDMYKDEIAQNEVSAKQPAKAKKRAATARTSTESLVDNTWPDRGEFWFRIAGTSFYQSELKALVGEHGTHESKQVFTAALVPEDDNPHDPKAVRVDIDRTTVGYLSRDDARSFRRRLGAHKLTDETTYCKAMIAGGYVRRTGERADYWVQLDIKEFA